MSTLQEVFAPIPIFLTASFSNSIALSARLLSLDAKRETEKNPKKNWGLKEVADNFIHSIHPPKTEKNSPDLTNLSQKSEIVDACQSKKSAELYTHFTNFTSSVFLILS